MPEYRIERLGHKGDGITTCQNFVRGVLPGEVISGEVESGRIPKPKILTSSPDRVAAPCRHAKSCGGCSLQHASDGFVKNWKKDQVATALKNQNVNWDLRHEHVSLPKSRRRAVLHGRRTKQGVLVGLKQRASENLVAIPDCNLVTSAILGAMPLLEDLVRLATSRRSEVDLTIIDTGRGLDIALTGAVALTRALLEQLAELNSKGSLLRLSWNGEVVLQSSPAHLNFGAAKVEPPPGSFLQATEDGERALVNAMLEAVQGAKSVVDLFAGCGTFSLPIAQFADVHAVEGVDEMLVALDQGWRNCAGLKAVTTEARDLFRRPLMPDELRKFDAVVIDPPRAGALAQCEMIAQSDVTKLGFVSCNPVTFARDAKILSQAGFKMSWLDVVDQFRWSTHVEVAAEFVRDAG